MNETEITSYPVKVDGLVAIGSRVRCASHKGTLVAYFTAPDERFGGTHLYGVIDLDEGYWATVDEDPHGSFVRMLVVHSQNIGLIEHG